MKAVYTNAFMSPLYSSLFTGEIGAMNDVQLAAYTDYIDEDSGWEYLMKSNETGSWRWRAPLPAVIFDFTTIGITSLTLPCHLPCPPALVTFTRSTIKRSFCRNIFFQAMKRPVIILLNMIRDKTIPIMTFAFRDIFNLDFFEDAISKNS